MRIDLLTQANQDWDSFVDNLGEEEKKELLNYKEAIDGNKIHYYVEKNDFVRFDQTIIGLSEKDLFQEELIHIIYKYYIERDLHELAFDYLNKCKNFFDKNKITIPDILVKLRDEYPDEETIKKLKYILGNLQSQRHEDIPRILPNNLNGKKDLSKFILNELIQATLVLLDKIHSIKQITHENRYNDLLLATLRLRLPIWGWTIDDQSRAGASSTGIDAGEIDISIKSAGHNIALVEALILKSGNFTKTEEHILKCNSYVNYLKRYYIIIYFRGPIANFDQTWQTYQSDVLNISYPSDFQIDIKEDFKDLSAEFNNVRNLKIAKTIHNSNIEMFHLMINLSKP